MRLIFFCVILNFIGKIFFIETLSKIPNLFYQYIDSIKLTFILNTSVILLTVIFGFSISIYFFVNCKALTLTAQMLEQIEQISSLFLRLLSSKQVINTTWAKSNPKMTIFKAWL